MNEQQPDFWHQAVLNAAHCAHLFTTGSGMLAHIHTEHSRLVKEAQAQADYKAQQQKAHLNEW